MIEKYVLFSLVMVLGASLAARAEDLKFKDDFLRRLVAAVPDILKTQDPKTGRFGEGIFLCTDQHPMFPLAVAWATKSKRNPYYHDEKVLEAIIKAGDALIEDMLPDGKWVFRKKDGSTWGDIYMPWTYSRWVRSFALIRDAMPPDARKRWEDALILGFTGISRTLPAHVHNIPATNAAALYIAGQMFDRPAWRDQAKAYMAKVVDAQDPGGFWSENYGPVVGYNSVYSDALGVYYASSGDETVLPALTRAAQFHANFTYPDGSMVETVDERTPYRSGLYFPNIGFTFSREGRGFIGQQLDLLARRGKPIAPDILANFVMHGQEGSGVPTAAGNENRTFMLGDGKALTRRKGPWFVCLSAYQCPIRESRWIQDRQNLASIFHDRCGLILGGGNTKLQPLWSSFTVGDTSLLKHEPGDTTPRFVPEGALFHIPSAAALKVTDPIGLLMKYGEEDCSIEVEPVDDASLRIRVRATSRSGEPVQAHLTFLPHLGEALRTERGVEKVLGEEPFTLSGDEAGGWIAHSGWKLTLPKEAEVTWPVFPHNPYRKDGRATTPEGRIVVSLPFAAEKDGYMLALSVQN
jgi:hypothetical protein